MCLTKVMRDVLPPKPVGILCQAPPTSFHLPHLPIYPNKQIFGYASVAQSTGTTLNKTNYTITQTILFRPCKILHLLGTCSLKAQFLIGTALMGGKGGSDYKSSCFVFFCGLGVSLFAW